MVSQLVKGIIPDQWQAYTVPRGATVIQWITDFSQRVKQLQEISQQVAQFGAGELKVHTVERVASLGKVKCKYSSLHAGQES